MCKFSFKEKISKLFKFDTEIFTTVLFRLSATVYRRKGGRREEIQQGKSIRKQVKTGKVVDTENILKEKKPIFNVTKTRSI